ncbi:TetR/AcrR family transcriptional regulator [Modestobacter versicolor]|uniref:AcrR family transcriptional regulator n=1 Tax=Modestobacter versicolor TaxID=429133 RepID=A0A323VCP1_9ACTN|nr:TetR/AcrR family transcriptional regulator C-terminal domain-containing protein [Modestobacter versicolor]MBB3677543.1 AcrR family transcriptional regulator [Modestobacter versicolor]PZA20986.1 TetR/AcrR family transcriptional regulator [Modestobacter versicolor]
MTERGRRVPLNRDRVLQAAVALADQVGVEALSMRRLAQELGVVPMALYKHVASKDELLDGMVDAVLGEVEPVDPALDWQDAVRRRVLSARRAVLRHPWARRAIESRTRRTPTVLGYMDALAGEFRAGGFSVDLTHHVMHALGNRMWGFSPELFEEPPREDPAPADPAEQEAVVRAFGQRYPHVLEIATAATGGDLGRVGEGCDEQFEFEFALDLLLDGFGRLQRQGWASRAQRSGATSPGASA